MKHYTVFADQPLDTDYPGVIIHNCANQMILWNARAKTDEVRNLASVARKHFGKVQVFAGKGIDRLTEL